MFCTNYSILRYVSKLFFRGYLREKKVTEKKLINKFQVLRPVISGINRWVLCVKVIKHFFQSICL